MGSKKIESLIEKYWAGETTIEEEMRLRSSFQEKTYQSIEEEDRYYFQLLDDFQSVQLPDSFDKDLLAEIKKRGYRMTIRRFLSIAATITLLISIGFIFVPRPIDQIKTAELQEAREAFELTKQALLLVSAELNRGAAFTQELRSFDETFQKIKSAEETTGTHKQ